MEPFAGETYSWVRRSKPGISQAGQGRKSTSRIVGLRGVGLGRKRRGLGARALAHLGNGGATRLVLSPPTGTVTSFQRPETVQRFTLP